MGKHIYVGNLPYDTTATSRRAVPDLRDGDERPGDDRQFTGRCRGFGFVEMGTTTRHRRPSPR